MPSKDITLKDIFEEVPHRLSKILSPAPIKELLPTALPSTELRVDFLARLEDESILHMEFQSFNDTNMPWRMLRYYTAIAEKYKTHNIKQLVVYVGNEKLRMKSSLRDCFKICVNSTILHNIPQKEVLAGTISSCPFNS